MSKNISNLSGRIGLKNNLFQKISDRSLNSNNSDGIKEIADEFLEFVSDSPIIAHNVDFDVGFLNYELSNCEKDKLTNKTIVLDPRIKGNVTVISNQDLDPDEAYAVFLSVLRLHGFSAIETGDNEMVLELLEGGLA